MDKPDLMAIFAAEYEKWAKDAVSEALKGMVPESEVDAAYSRGYSDGKAEGEKSHKAGYVAAKAEILRHLVRSCPEAWDSVPEAPTTTDYYGDDVALIPVIDLDDAVKAALKADEKADRVGGLCGDHLSMFEAVASVAQDPGLNGVTSMRDISELAGVKEKRGEYIMTQLQSMGYVDWDGPEAAGRGRCNTYRIVLEG